jgi:hypothetical protein
MPPKKTPDPQNRLPAFLTLPGTRQSDGHIPGLTAQTHLTLGIDLLTSDLPFRCEGDPEPDDPAGSAPARFRAEQGKISGYLGLPNLSRSIRSKIIAHADSSPLARESIASCSMTMQTVPSS